MARSPATLKAFNPTLRDKLASFVLGDAPAASFKGKALEALLGSTGLGNTGALGGMGLIDATPLGLPFQAFEAGRQIATPKQRLAGVGNAALAIIPLPAAAKGVKAAAKVAGEGLAKFVGKEALEAAPAVSRTAALAAKGPTPLPGPEVAGFKDIRSPRRDYLHEVVDANFEAGKVVGNQMAPIGKLKGGVSTGPHEQARVDDLVRQIGSDDGYYERLIVDQDGNVIEGQHRLDALRKLGVKKVPIIRVQDTLAGFPSLEVKEAINAAKTTHSDHVNQITAQLADIFAQEKGNVARIRKDWSAPAGFKDQWEAGLAALEKQKAPTPKGGLDALMAEAKAQRQARETQVAALNTDDKPVRFTHGTEGRGAIVSPDLESPGRWRLTRLDGEGPVGHTEYADKGAALDDALREHYVPPAAAAPAEPLSAFHGSTAPGLTELQPGERGPFGPASYLSPLEHVAKRYAGDAGHVYEAQIGDSIFNGLGSRDSSVNPYQVWRDQVSKLVAAAGDKGADIAVIAEKMQPADGYPFFRRVSQLLGSDDAAQALFRKAGFSGVSGHVDGPEIAMFGKVPLKAPPPAAAPGPLPLPLPDGSSPPLDMSEAARMARAAEQGFTVPVFHGTPDARDVLATGQFKSLLERFGNKDPEVTHWAAADHKTASSYADDRRAWDYQNAEPATLKAMMKLKNPLVIEAGGQKWTGTKEAVDAARAAGHDGVIVKNVVDDYMGHGKPTTTYAVFDSDGIKLAADPFHPAGAAKSPVRSPSEFKARGPLPVPVSAPPIPDLLPDGSSVPLDMSAAARMARAEEQGIVAPVYHGAMRGDRIAAAGGFKADRATSGPMSFFTDDPQIASNYATGKQDTSHDIEDLEKYWTAPSGKKGFDAIWSELDPLTRSKIRNEGHNVAQVYGDGESFLSLDPKHADDRLIARSTLDHYISDPREGRGNPIRGLWKLWYEGGNMVDDPGEFKKLLGLFGAKGHQFDDPYAQLPTVFPTALDIKNPLDTTNIPEAVRKDIRKAAKTAPPALPPEHGADQWDKRTSDPQQWLERFEEGLGQNTGGWAWTTVPDWVTDVLKKHGYDGIKDGGGKMGGAGHNVFIPFREDQVRSALDAFHPAGDAKGPLMPASDFKTRGPLPLPVKAK